jgi:VIT1/CCC1 family predicted Fe2+/Mn2+ transporter
MRAQHRERHQNTRIGWLRATVLGANDGIVSTASLIVGVAASGAARGDLLVAGTAALVAGAMSMAAGEYVSVSSQADTERADLAREAQELRDDPEFELRELTQIYVGRGLEPALALQVATQLMAKDALGAHARDELNIVDATAARPVQAALASAASFSAGAILPLICAMAAPNEIVTSSVVVTSLISLAALGAVSAQLGGAGLMTAVLRVTIWGALALTITAIVGRMFGAVA